MMGRCSRSSKQNQAWINNLLMMAGKVRAILWERKDPKFHGYSPGDLNKQKIHRALYYKEPPKPSKEIIEKFRVNHSRVLKFGMHISGNAFNVQKVTSTWAHQPHNHLAGSRERSSGMLPISVLLRYLPIPAHRRRDRARKQLAEIFSKIIQNRRASGKSGNAMLQAFIDSKYRATGRSLTDNEITGLLIAALFAGQHTSSITSTWTGAYLLKYKQFLEPVLEEQRQVMQRHGDKLDYDVLAEMDVLYGAIKEALRLHPPLILLLRYNHRDFSVKTREGHEYVVPKGHVLATSPAFSNRLPYIYRDPDTYDPNRFKPGREEDKVGGAFSYISFGGGRHGCLGEPFAYMQIKTIWSHLFRNYELEPVSPFPEIDWDAMVVGVKGKVMVRYKKRKLSAY